MFLEVLVEILEMSRVTLAHRSRDYMALRLIPHFKGRCRD
jgi:hypothetical protein